MDKVETAALFQNLTTPHVADACLRSGVVTDFISRRSWNPALTFRQHLRRIGGAVEE